MRCVSCNKELSDYEANLKWDNCEGISNPEDKYIGLCSCCYHQSFYEEDPVEEQIDIYSISNEDVLE